MRMIVANEPQAYRDVMAGAVRELRPHVEVVMVHPDDLNAAVQSLVPQVVLCSREATVVETVPLATIVLYPGGRSLAVVTVEGRRRTSTSLDFDAVLAIVDEVELLNRRAR